MRDNFFTTFLGLLSGQSQDQLGLVQQGYSDLRWFTVALYWSLLAAGIAVAVVNWRADERQRTGYHVTVFLMRYTMASLWYLGSLWKLPWPVAAGFKFWLASTVKYNQFHWNADFMQIALDHIGIVQPLVYLLEIAFTASLMLGCFVRVTGFLAAFFTFNLLIGLYNNPTEWPWTYVSIIVSHVLFALVHAGRSLGLCNLLEKWLIPEITDERLVRAIRWAD